MARRTRQQGSSDTSRGPRSYVLGAVLVMAVLLVLFVGGPSADEGPSQAPTTAAVQGRAEVREGPPGDATDEDFCAGFVALANRQVAFVSRGGTSPEPLQRAADDLLAVGVPPTMGLLARTGYHAVLSSIYASIGTDLAPAAVGAAPATLEGADEAFTAYLDQWCPA